MLHRILLITTNTFREAVRNKVFYTLIFFALLLAAFSVTLSTMIIGSYTRIIVDMGLAIIEIIGTMIAIFVGITLVYKEIEKRTIYPILARPIHRFEFVMGKFLGLSLTLLLEVAFMAMVIMGIVVFNDGAAEVVWILKGVSMIGVQLMLMVAVAVMFSAISTPILSGMFTIGFYLIGTTSAYLPYLVDDKTSASMRRLIDVVGFIAPNFDIFNYKGVIIHHVALGLESYLYSLLYGCSYIGIILTIAIMGFRSRDLK